MMLLNNTDIQNQKKSIIIRASSIQKISTCPASFLLGLALALEDRLEDDKEKYAEEGTLLHEEMKEIVEFFLEEKKKGKKPSINRDSSKKSLTLEQMQSLNSCFEYVCNYITFDSIVYTEKTFSKTEEKDDLIITKKGTTDLIVYDKITHTLNIFDYKFGYNKVDVYKNQQLTFYAMLALEAFKNVDIEAKNVIIHVIQPRVHNINSYKLSLEEINNFEIYLNEVVKKITQEKPEYNPSEEACRYCKCKKYCPAISNLVVKFTDVSRVPELTQEQKKYILDNESLILKVIESIKEEVINNLCNDKPFFNYYLRTRTTRVYNEETIGILESKYGGEIYSKKLLGVTELERKFGKEIKDLPFTYKKSIVLTKEAEN